MPHNLDQWIWFAFYTGGAAGGWVLLVASFAAVMKRVRRGR
jgi:hypothetical protein